MPKKTARLTKTSRRATPAKPRPASIEGREARRALLRASAPAIAAALAKSTKTEPVVVVARPDGDTLASSSVTQFSWRVVNGVAVGILEREDFLRHLGPAVAAEIEASIREGVGPTGVWAVCIAWGGATASSVGGVSRRAE